MFRLPSFVIPALLGALAAWPCAAAEPVAGGLPPGYQLVWADEFDRAGLPDASKWQHDTSRNFIGWYNSERQYYSAPRAENARVAEGRLVIEARLEKREEEKDWGGQAYSSARLMTRELAAWTYGFFEARAKLPCGRGTWPAIWMLSAPPHTRWPHDGEIDIMEMVGFEPEVIHGSVHTRAYHHSIGTHRTAKRTLAGACNAFHRYQLHWTPSHIRVGIDDEYYFEFANDGAGTRGTWPFNKPQYLILNLAVGGEWGGQKGIDDAAFPQRLEVDYVRVYQAPPAPPAPASAPAPAPASAPVHAPVD